MGSLPTPLPVIALRQARRFRNIALRQVKPGDEALRRITSGTFHGGGVSLDPIDSDLAYCFSPPPTAQGRFRPDGWPAWYGAEDLNTTIDETLHAVVRKLDDVVGATLPRTFRRVVYVARVTGDCGDVRGLVASHPWLRDRSRGAHPATFPVAVAARSEGRSGIEYLSSRCDGDCSVIYDGAVIKAAREFEVIDVTYTVTPDRMVQVHVRGVLMRSESLDTLLAEHPPM